MFTNTLIAGAGNWGTTFADLLSRNGHPVTILAVEEEVYNSLSRERINHKYLPEIQLNPEVKFIRSMTESDRNFDLIILALPANALNGFMQENTDILQNTAFLNLSKGIDIKSGKRMSEILKTHLPECQEIATLSGPNIAPEIAARKPAIAAVASENQIFARKIQNFVSGPSFRAYVNPDLTGVEFCGALKNIIAIGAGICHGLELGDNAIAALITRGIAEIKRFGCFFGAHPLTFFGMAGVGDLTVTCMSPKSRNNSIGRLLAKGLSLTEAQTRTGMVAEGVFTCRITHELALKNNIYMPITNAIYRTLFENISPKQAITELMESTLKEEFQET
jgi:glycerol-3-phosphate dehydrogenase (NAD(P)+)